MPTKAMFEDEQWEIIQPKVNAEAEFYEILNDFGDPLEVLREAISNSVDAHATWIKIEFSVEVIDGSKRLVIRLTDNGDGMSKEVLTRDFWGLGYSPSRERKDANTIGEKGHGTKIFLRSEYVTVRTQTTQGAYQSECHRPLAALSGRQLHQPRLKTIEPFGDHQSGTEITIIGYNDNERSKFVQDVVRDYILWFTKVGSIEWVFGITQHDDFKVYLKCIDRDDFDEINFGHVFPDENSDIDKLFNQLGTGAADWFVKRYLWEDERLKNHPEVTYQAFISIEGDEIKRSYNPMIRERIRQESGKYRVGDRYGLWLCKDYIPIMRINEWIVNFGSGSNAYVLLHGFINCQSLKLTANRGTIANTDPLILEELRIAVQDHVRYIDTELANENLYTLRSWQQEQITLEQEQADFNRRLKNLKTRKTAILSETLLVEPTNESELFGLFVMIYALHPELFPFELIDYNTTRGIDIIARNKGQGSVSEGAYWYIELKHKLRTKFNHAFKHLRWIICWDFDKNIGIGSEFTGIEEIDERVLQGDYEDSNHIYFLDNRKRATKIEVIRLREFLKEKLGVEFETQVGYKSKLL